MPVESPVKEPDIKPVAPVTPNRRLSPDKLCPTQVDRVIRKIRRNI